MFLEISKIPEGVSNQSIKEKPSELNLKHRDTKFPNDVFSDITLIRHERKILVDVKSYSDILLSCARCLCEYPYKLISEFDFAVQLVEGAPSRVELMDDDFLSVSLYDGIIDLSQRIRDALLLEIPMLPLCNKNCKGLCPKCGTNLNEKECGCKSTDEDNPFANLKRIIKMKGE